MTRLPGINIMDWETLDMVVRHTKSVKRGCLILHLKIVMLKDMVKNIHILITTVSSLIGVAYFAYISSVKFPPDALRIVPLVWLIGAVTGLMLAFRSLRGDGAQYIGILIIVVAIINILFASIFSLAALMGD